MTKKKSEILNIEEIIHLSNKDQAEAIAESINKISQEYEEVKPEDINIPDIPPNTIPKFSPRQILQYLSKFKTNKATIPGDIPAQDHGQTHTKLSLSHHLERKLLWRF